MARWQPEELVRRYGDSRFVVSGEFTWGGHKLDGRMKLKHYMRFAAEYPKADWPFCACALVAKAAVLRAHAAVAVQAPARAVRLRVSRPPAAERVPRNRAYDPF